ncbi:histidine kinase [Cohnella sp. JJ-181]|uniref:histidine kinase n=1 Tax=Cohnella rhizoplanae TaxID=2974897 RepID=UPI00232D8B3B|nr:histidine kinase [Cohnella sp. JJ-181]
MRTYLRHFTNHMKIRNKLILSFVAVVLVPTLIVGVYLTVELRTMALRGAAEQIETNMDRVKKRTLDLLNVSYDISYRLSNDTRLGQLANNSYDTTYSVVNAYRDYPDFKEYVNLYREIMSVRLYVDNPTLIDNWEIIPTDEQTKKTDWYRWAKQSDGLIRWSYIQDSRDGARYLSLIRRIDFYKHSTNGVLVINANSAMLNGILSQESFDTMLVADRDIVAANDSGLVGKTLEELSLEPDIADRRSGAFMTRLGDRRVRIQIVDLYPDNELINLRILSVFSVDDIVREPNRIIRSALTAIGVGLVVALVLILALSKLIGDRLLRLSKHISRVATGKLDLKLAIDGKDEIGQLSRQFNAMLGSIRALMGEVTESNRQKRELETKQNEIKLRMLASQINPHFLFNTLESIRMKAVVRKEADIARTVKLLGKMMRKNLEAGSGVIPVSAEFDMIGCYLDIQKFRYEDRLQYKLDIDPGAMSASIPSLIIQPIVENAVIHGMENKEGAVTVEVALKMRDEGLCVEIRDDGAGMSAGRLAEVVCRLNDPEDGDGSDHIGLRNVNARLRLSFGEGYGLSIESAPEQGTCVRFVIPGEKGAGNHA